MKNGEGLSLCEKSIKHKVLNSIMI